MRFSGYKVWMIPTIGLFVAASGCSKGLSSTESEVSGTAVSSEIPSEIGASNIIDPVSIDPVGVLVAPPAVSTPEQGLETVEGESPEDPTRKPETRNTSTVVEVSPPERTPRFVVHEWGTYTSVQSSIGETMKGLHHEEEPLPDFVHGRDFGCNNAKCMEEPMPDTTQKLETPVIYFYHPEPIEFSVSVSFPNGIISQWYPGANSFSPPIGQPALEGGEMTWSGTLLDEPADLPFVYPEDIWAPSRNVKSRSIRVEGEDENFIFYRGLGAFTPPFKALSKENGMLEIRNDSDELIPAVFALEVFEDGASIQLIGAIGAHSSKEIKVPLEKKEMEWYLDNAPRNIAEALQKTGLYPDEAWAMVDTWTKSYFLTPGLRLLYVVPPSWTDELLPLEVSPQPDEIVRTLVGRVEVLTPDVEADVVDQIIESSEGQSLEFLEEGRFMEPKIRRACQLLVDSPLVDYCEALVINLSMQQ